MPEERPQKGDEMIYILAYILIGIATGIWTWFGQKNDEARLTQALVWPLIWPLVWYMVIVIYWRGENLTKCIWCGKTVAPQRMSIKTKALWREHYLNDCDKHPLLEKIHDGKAAK